ncbi:MAG: DUF499 domain-containing protein [Planctomycetota bacterium]
MPLPTIFDLCTPRDDVKQGRARDEEFAADLTKVVMGKAVPEYGDPAIFFRNTHPTRGLKTLLETVCRRLSGVGGELNSVLRLDTQFGGGKTHNLIALVHAVRGQQNIPDVREFIDPALLPRGKVRVAALDGENADPANGLQLESGMRAHSWWGEMAYRLAGPDGYRRVQRSDEQHIAPGAETIVELFGDEPTLILMDEVGVYLRKAAQAFPDRVGQFAAFLQALLKAVASTPRVALVCTLAIRASDHEATDAYQREQTETLRALEEAESVAARKLLQIDPTAEDETVAVLRRRLFSRIDDQAAMEVLDAYYQVWDRNREMLPSLGTQTREQFARGYPFHPETLAVLTKKVASLSNFQRIRGMVRLLARTVHHLWKVRPADAFAVHPHHIDVGETSIRSELTTRLGQQAFLPALDSDIAAVEGKELAIAQRLDRDEFAGMPNVASHVARTAFLHTLAFGDAAQGAKPETLRLSVCSPVVDPSLVESARKRFIQESLYLDDRPGAPLRFRTEPNLTQLIQRAIRDVDPDELRNHLNVRIKDLFKGTGSDLEIVPFPSGPHELPDEVEGGRPFLAVLSYDAHAVADHANLPADLLRMCKFKGVRDEFRALLNNFVFLAADKHAVPDMKQAVAKRLALMAIQSSDQFQQLPDYQQEKVKEELRKSESTVALAVLQCYRHIYYPSPRGVGDVKLAHTSVEIPSASDTPGNGQVFVKRALREQKKLLVHGDTPDAPTFVRDQTPLRTRGESSTGELRMEYRRAPGLSLLLDDSPLTQCIQAGIDGGQFIYREGDKVWGKGDPRPSIRIADSAFVATVEFAKKQGLWPRVPKPEPGQAPTPPVPTRTDPTSGGPQGPTAGAAPTQQQTFQIEGMLATAVKQLFEKARQAKVRAFRWVSVRVFDLPGLKNLHAALATYRDGNLVVDFEFEVRDDDVEAFRIQFKGSYARGSKVRASLEALLNAAKEVDVRATYRLVFEPALATSTEKEDALGNLLTRNGSGEAFVEAEAAAQGGG